MTEASIRRILEQVAAGQLSATAAMRRLRDLPFADLGFAKLDYHRTLRRGVPEVVLGERKSAAQIVSIAHRMVEAGANFIVTRLTADKARVIKRELPALDYHAEALIGTALSEPPVISGHGIVTVITAGTSDIQVAEEAVLCAELFGNRVARLYDVGVAGLHRLTAKLAMLHAASVLIVIAGMEGALPSVVAGLIDKPIIAVPTSVGYGTGMGGFAAMLGMLNTCSSGITVVNIDNGFGAAFAATLINRVGLDRDGGT
ncbi:MAG: nickel pincer cofactor biosynthesis protein LarB [Candidatus Binataceae bacterium]